MVAQVPHYKERRKRTKYSRKGRYERKDMMADLNIKAENNAALNEEELENVSGGEMAGVGASRSNLTRLASRALAAAPGTDSAASMGFLTDGGAEYEPATHGGGRTMNSILF